MENQHKLISGYRDLAPHEIDMMNELKELERKTKEVVVGMRGDETLDQRWVSIGLTHVEQGFMALVRSVAQPE